MLPVYKNKDGEKMYPVCSFEKNEHKLENMLDILYVRRAEAEEQKDWKEAEQADSQYHEVSRLLNNFRFNTNQNGIVYATYEERNKIKDYIAAYDVRHGWTN